MDDPTVQVQTWIRLNRRKAWFFVAAGLIFMISVIGEAQPVPETAAPSNLITRTGDSKKAFDAAKTLLDSSSQRLWEDVVALDTARSKSTEEMISQLNWWKTCGASKECLTWLAETAK